MRKSKIKHIVELLEEGQSVETLLSAEEIEELRRKGYKVEATYFGLVKASKNFEGRGREQRR